MGVAICPGSFDPVTKGHIDIILRASKLFDKVIVVVLTNPKKEPTFDVDERMKMLEICLINIKNVEIECFDGLLADFAAKKGAFAIVKGLRAVSDYEYEFQMAMTNKVLNENIESIFLTTSAEYMYLSSSIVKQVASFGGDISQFVPPIVLDIIKKRLYNNPDIIR